MQADQSDHPHSFRISLPNVFSPLMHGHSKPYSIIDSSRTMHCLIFEMYDHTRIFHESARVRAKRKEMEEREREEKEGMRETTG